MFSFIKKTAKTVLFAGLIVGSAGAAAMLVAPERAKAMFHQFQSHVVEHIDQHIDDPTALRMQLEELEKEYPKRIGAVRSDIAELNEQIRQLESDRAIAERVVALADRDLSELEPAVEEATAAAATGKAQLASITFDHQIYSIERAGSKLNQIRHTRVAYANRSADAEHDLMYLQQQENRLDELLAQLENERSQFQAQIWQLSRQVDSIARNERLIGLMEKRNRTIEECSRYEVSSFDQLTDRLNEIRSRQEAELESLTSTQRQVDYEELARMQLNSESRMDDLPTDVRELRVAR